MNDGREPIRLNGRNNDATVKPTVGSIIRQYIFFILNWLKENFKYIFSVSVIVAIGWIITAFGIVIREFPEMKEQLEALQGIEERLPYSDLEVLTLHPGDIVVEKRIVIDKDFNPKDAIWIDANLDNIHIDTTMSKSGTATEILLYIVLDEPIYKNETLVIKYLIIS